jgi:ATP-binding cassette, subfamily G (WHITE), member 2, SNQ2
VYVLSWNRLLVLAHRQRLVVLGRPGSGCTTLLKTLANLREEYHAVKGDVYYDSISPDDLKNYARGDIQYCPEEDIHFPTLTVDQTLNFATKTRAPHVRIDYTRNEYTKFVTDILTTTFGLNHAKKTPIGNAAIRGISGGEKKRVSIAEVLSTRSCITAWDKFVNPYDSPSIFLSFIFFKVRHEDSTPARPLNSFMHCALLQTP